MAGIGSAITPARNCNFSNNQEVVLTQIPASEPESPFSPTNDCHGGPDPPPQQFPASLRLCEINKLGGLSC
jgi:hypothetical protein